MRRYKGSTQLCFDDVLLVPSAYSGIKSRYDVDLSMDLGVETRPDSMITLKLPIIASPMDTVCEWQMANTLGEHGGLGIIHRFMDVEKRVEHLKMVQTDLVGVAVSLIEAQDPMVIRDLIEAGARVLCVDTANGHASRAIEAVVALRSIVPSNIHIMCGNVSTYAAYSHLITAGADSVRVGIGGGSACTTRLVSGHGMPTLASILDCARMGTDIDKAENGIGIRQTSIIADGGIRTTGDMVKSFAAGASAVMLGSMLSGYDESPGDAFYDAENRLVKAFRGMASREAQEDWLGGVSVSEGVSTSVPYKGPVSEIIGMIRGGLGSGCSYSNARKLSELFYTSEYVQVTGSSLEESMPHSMLNSTKRIANFGNKHLDHKN